MLVRTVRRCNLSSTEAMTCASHARARDVGRRSERAVLLLVNDIRDAMLMMHEAADVEEVE